MLVFLLSLTTILSGHLVLIGSSLFGVDLNSDLEIIILEDVRRKGREVRSGWEQFTNWLRTESSLVGKPKFKVEKHCFSSSGSLPSGHFHVCQHLGSSTTCNSFNGSKLNQRALRCYYAVACGYNSFRLQLSNPCELDSLVRLKKLSSCM